jgi:hypothetical protein
MGAGPWLVYNTAKQELMSAKINLAADQFYYSLFLSASNASDLTLINYSQVTAEVADGFGYTTGGQKLQNVTWDVGDSPDEWRFSADTATWNASGGDIVGIQYVVLRSFTSGLLLAVASVDEVGPINVPNGNPFVIAPGAEGIFELN